MGRRLYHKPLITTVKRPIYNTPARVQRLLIRLRKYDIDVHYKPGKFMFIPDTLSRAFVKTDNRHVRQTELETECQLKIHTVTENWNCSEIMKVKIVNETNSDPCLKAVKSYINLGWPENIADCTEAAKLYWTERNEFTLVNDMVVFRDRIVIPKVLRKELLDRIHASHQGRVRCKSSARNKTNLPAKQPSS